VHRTLPHRERTTIGPFIFFDQMGPAKLDPGAGIDVRPHPHINLATVTYLFAGAIDHRDSLGTFATIEPGAVNLMTAGKGITHSERSPASERPDGPELSGIQTWLALPSAKEETDPAFEHVAKSELPVVEGGGARARIVMGHLWGATSPVTCHSPTIYADIHLSPGGAMPIDPEADERALYVAEGEASLDGQPLDRSTLYVIRPGLAATLRSETGGHVMLCGGAPLDGPRHVFWNFVSSRRGRINQAKEDWKAGRFALPPDDHDEFIPLPEVVKTVSYP
jgi:redox-sensitive bicupin YhaK (pirin superfamily)